MAKAMAKAMRLATAGKKGVGNAGAGKKGVGKAGDGKKGFGKAGAKQAESHGPLAKKPSFGDFLRHVGVADDEAAIVGRHPTNNRVRDDITSVVIDLRPPPHRAAARRQTCPRAARS